MQLNPSPQEYNRTQNNNSKISLELVHVCLFGFVTVETKIFILERERWNSFEYWF